MGSKLLKEIYEQPEAISNTLENGFETINSLFRDKPLGGRIVFLGMGSSYFASIYAKYLFSKFPKISVDVISAAEYLHYPMFIDNKSLIFAISQSGESIETVKVVKKLWKKGLKTCCLTNSPDSSLARLSDYVLLTYAGEEKCSATKTFLATLALIYMLWVNAGAKKSYFTNRYKKNAVRKLSGIAGIIQDKLDSWNNICQNLAPKVNNANSLIILGRGYNLCTALQGSLLFKEVSKIHAEGMAGGRFRHGPIDLTNPNLLVISLATGRTKQLMYKIAEEVKTLGGGSILITDEKSIATDDDVFVDKVDEPLSPILFTVPLELIAYNSAISKGLDPDFRRVPKITSIE